MLDRFLNPTPTFYKWDKFFTGAIPALILPFIALAGIFVISVAYSKFNYHEVFTMQQFLHSLQSPNVFLRTASLSCMANAALFFFFIQRNYYNASRGVIIITMLFVLAIVFKEML